jgi:hypothetical protein
MTSLAMAATVLVLKPLVFMKMSDKQDRLASRSCIVIDHTVNIPVVIVKPEVESTLT